MQRLPNYNPAEHTPRLEDAFLTRREWLQRTGMGMGALSLAMMLGEQPASAVARRPRAVAPLHPPLLAEEAATCRPRPSTSSTSSPAAGLRTSIPGIPSRPWPSTTDQTLPGPERRWPIPSPFKFEKKGKSRHRGQRGLPAARRVRRRHVRHPLDVDRRPRPRAGLAVHAHRLAADPQAEHGLVGGLRPGHREPEHARLHLAGRQGRVPPGVVPAEPVPGRRTSTTRRTCR